MLAAQPRGRSQAGSPALQNGVTINQIIHGNPTGGGAKNPSLRIVDASALARYRRENPEFDQFVKRAVVGNTARGQKNPIFTREHRCPSAEFRKEARQMLREMKPGEKLQTLLSADDPLFRMAAIEAPNSITKIDDRTRELIVQRVIEDTYPGALASLERDEEAIEHLKAMVQVLEGTARAAADIPAQAFDSFLVESVGDHSRLDADVERSLADAT
jgi:hypothetical protein